MRRLQTSWTETLTKLGFKRRRRRHSRKSDRFYLRRRPQLESLEERAMLAVVTIGNDTDVYDGDDTNITALLADPGTDGTISLREAIVAANNTSGADTLEFDENLFAAGPTSIVLGSLGHLQITEDLDIDGPGAEVLTIDGDDANYTNRVFYVSSSSAVVTIRGLTITGGYLTGGSSGGGIYNSGDLTLDGVVVADNYTGGAGGGIYNNVGNLTIVNSTIESNDAAKGAGIYHNGNGGGNIEVINSAVILNDAFSAGSGTNRGGGLYVYSFTTPYATASIVNSTFSGNDAGIGGAIFVNGSPTIEIVNSTIAANNGGQQSGGIHNSLSTALIELHNSIVAGNTAGVSNTANLAGTFSSASSYNLIGTGYDGGFSPTLGNLLSISDPGLTSLGSYGGPTLTHALLDDSPAIDHGSTDDALDAADSPLAVDQRGLSRNVDHPDIDDGAGGTVDIGAFEWYKPLLQVDTLADEDDGDYGPGDLSLREALALAGAINGDNTIEFAPNVIGTITLDSALVIGASFLGDVTINGPGADFLTIDAGGSTNLLDFTSNSGTDVDQVAISGLKLTGASGTVIDKTYGDGTVDLSLSGVEIIDNGGKAVSWLYGGNVSIESSYILDNGGGVAVSFAGTLNIDQTEIAGNSGGVSSSFSGAVTITASTIAENTATALSLNSASANLTNTTISSNETTGTVGALSVSYATATLTNVTVTQNRADSDDTSGSSTATGGLFAGSNGTITLYNTIVAENWAGDESTGIMADLGRSGGTFSASSAYNLIGYDPDTSNNIDNGEDNNQVGGEASAPAIDSRLAPLARYGGPTRSHALLDDSAAIDAGDPNFDPESYTPPLDYDQRGASFDRVLDGDGDSIARLDIGALESGKPLLQVDTLRDENDGYYGKGDLSLREALYLASLIEGDDTITFAPGLFASGSKTLTLKYDGADSGTVPDQLLIDSNVTIEGPGGDLLTISGDDVTRVFQIEDDVTAAISGLSIFEGNAGSEDGGAIYNLGDLTLDEVDIADSTARYGGAIYTEGVNSSLTVDMSSIVGNMSTDDRGGGVYVAGGTVVITLTTIDGNTATEGGGVYLYDATEFELCNTAVSRSVGSGIYVDAAFSGTLLVENSTISNNSGDGLRIESADNSTDIDVMSVTIADNASRGIHVDSGTTGITLRNSIVAENEGASDVYGPFSSSSGFNLIGIVDGSSGLSGDPDSYIGDSTTPFDARITPLGKYGGPTETHALMYDSMAIDAADTNTAPTDDQRGATHVDFDGAGSGTASAEMGSFGAANPLTVEGAIVVGVADDDEYRDNPTGALSLREALREAAESTEPNPTIVFDPTVFIGPRVIQLSEMWGPLQIASNVTILGPGAEMLTIDANGEDAVFLFPQRTDSISASISGLTLTGASEAAIWEKYETVSDLEISEVVIAANEGSGISRFNYGGGGVTVSDSRILNNGGYGIVVDGSGNLAISNTEVAHNGQGIKREDGALQLVDSSVTDNDGFGVFEFDGVATISGTEIARNGNGITAEGAILTLSDSTIALNEGAGINVNDGAAEVVNTTISGNASGFRFYGAGISTAILTNVTVVNSSGTGVFADSLSTVELHNTLVSGNSADLEIVDDGSNPPGEFSALSSHNFIGHDPEGLFPINNGNQVGTISPIDPILGPLVDNGGGTRTYALLPGSPAIDAGSNAAADAAGLTTDQRGYNRFVTRDSSLIAAGDFVDIGAYEWGLIVSEGGDVVDSDKGHGDLTLREALTLSSALPGKNEITFDPVVFNGPTTIALTTGTPLTVNSDVALMGPGAELLTISGNDQTRVFTIGSYPTPAIVLIEGINIADGNAYAGGGMQVSYANFTLSKSRVTQNQASTAGGGIDILTFGNVRIVDSEISDNVVTGNPGVTGHGGGISQYQGTEFNWLHDTLEVINSTISGNVVMSSNGRGGGVFTYSEYAPSSAGISTVFINSTVTNNTADIGGGAYTWNDSPVPSVFETYNSVFVDNRQLNGDSNDVDGLGFHSAYNNLVRSDSTLSFDLGGTYNVLLGASQSTGLAPLGYYGGKTRTHALLPGSPAIDAGDNDLAVDADGNLLLYDQNGPGFDRILNGTVDIGASEAHVILDGTDLSVYGTDWDESITVREQSVAISRIGTFDVDLSGVNSIAVDALAGNDFVTIDAAFTIQATVHGGPGNDTILGGSGEDVLYGDSGADTIYGGAGDDMLFGGSGNDQLYGEAGDDALDGGPGNDQLHGGADSDTLNGGDGQDQTADDPNDDLTAVPGDNRAPLIVWFGNAYEDLLETPSFRPTYRMGADERLEAHLLAYDPDGDDLTYVYRVYDESNNELTSHPFALIYPGVEFSQFAYIPLSEEQRTAYVNSLGFEKSGSLVLSASNTIATDIRTYTIEVVAIDSHGKETATSFDLELVPRSSYLTKIIPNWYSIPSGAITVPDSTTFHWFHVLYEKNAGSEGPVTTPPTIYIELDDYDNFGSPITYEVVSGPGEFVDSVYTWAMFESDFHVPHRIEYQATTAGLPAGAGNERTSIFTFHIQPELQEFNNDAEPTGSLHNYVTGTPLGVFDSGEPIFQVDTNGVSGEFALDPSIERGEPQHGALDFIEENNTWVYIPEENYTGLDSFWYYLPEHGTHTITDIDGAPESSEPIPSNISYFFFRVGSGVSFELELEDREFLDAPSLGWLSSDGPSIRTDQFSGNVRFGMPIGVAQFATYMPDPGPSVMQVNYQYDSQFFRYRNSDPPPQVSYSVFLDDDPVPAITRNNSIPSQGVPLGSQGTFHVTSSILGHLKPSSSYRRLAVGGGSGGGMNTFRASTIVAYADLRQEDFGFGPGWNLAGLERIIAPLDGTPGNLPIYWIRSDGYILTFDGYGSAARGDEDLHVVDHTVGYGYGLSDKYGNITKFDADGWITSREDQYGRTTSYHYTNINDEYDEDVHEIRLITHSFKAEKIVFLYEPNSEGFATPKVETIRTYPDGRQVSFLPNGTVINPIPDGDVFRETHLTYSGDRLAQIIVPIDTEGETTTSAYTHFFYDVEGRLTAYKDLDGKWTNFEYSSDGDVVRTIYADASSTLLVRSQLNEFTKSVYRKASFIAAGGGSGGATRSLGPATKFVPNLSRVGTLVDELGRISTFRTNNQGYVVETTDATGRIMKYTRNSIGQVSSETLLETTDDGNPIILDLTLYEYDSNFNLTSVVYADGTSEHWTYEIIDVDDPDYDPAFGRRNRLSSYTDQLGRTTTYAYEDYDEIVNHGLEVLTVRQIVGDDDTAEGVTEHNDIVTIYEYNDHGLLAMMREQRYNYEGTQLGEIRTKYDYTSLVSGPFLDYLEPGTEDDFINGKWLRRITYAEGISEEFVVEILEHDEYGNPTKIKDGEERVTEYDYDERDLLKQIIYPEPGSGQAQPTVMFEYTNTGRLKRVSEASIENIADISKHIATLYQYDNRQRLYQVTENYTGFSPSETKYEFDRAGNVTAVIADQWGLDRRTEFVYDDLNRPIRITEPDPDGPFGSALAPVTLLAYDALGRVVAASDPQRNVSIYEYDQLHRLTKVHAPIGASNSVGRGVTEYDYDAAGQLTSMTDAEGRVTTYEYDDAGRLSKLFEPATGDPADNVPIVFEYDTQSNLRRVTDQLGHSTTYTYDRHSRLTEETDALGKTTEYGYNDAHELVSLLDPENNETVWTYDDAGRVATETNELDDTRSYTYDEFNRLIEVEDRNGRVIQYDYNNFHQLDEERWYDTSGLVNTIDYNFNALGELKYVSDSSATYNATYNNLGQQEQLIIDLTSAGFEDEITLDREFVNHRLTETSARLGTFFGFGGNADFVNSYQYDALDRLTRITQDGGSNVADKRVDLSYDADGRLTSIRRFDDVTGFSTVATSYFGYDPRGRLATLDHSGVSGYSFGYDEANRLETFGQYLAGWTGYKYTNYTYDNRNQLIGVDYVGDFFTDESYDYDQNGNRQAYEIEVGINNRLYRDDLYSNATYDYDAEGNRTRRNGYESYTKYEWDHRNRLVAVIDYDDNGTPSNEADDVVTKSVEYEYDAFNQLVKRTVGADGDGTSSAAIDQTFFLYDMGQVVLEFHKQGEETVAATDLAHRYLWNPAAVDQLFADEQVTSLQSPGTNLWALTDHLGSIRDVIDSNGTVRIHRDYDSFGNVVEETHYNVSGTEVTSGSGYVDVAFRYTGRYFDDETGLQNNLHRWYDASTGQWISEDPIGFAAGDANLNRYVGNEPTGYIDPAGLESFGGDIGREFGYGGSGTNTETWRDRLEKLRAIGWGFTLGVGQGATNIANGLQDTAIGLANLPGGFVNGIAWLEEKAGILDSNDPVRVPKIPSPDWSRDLITTEGGEGWSDSHEWSKGLGAAGVAAGIAATKAAQAARVAAEKAEAAAAAAKEFATSPLRQPSYTPPYNPRMPRFTPRQPNGDYFPRDPRFGPGPPPPFSNN
jgi:RHS repeat-associated protein